MSFFLHLSKGLGSRRQCQIPISIRKLLTLLHPLFEGRDVLSARPSNGHRGAIRAHDVDRAHCQLYICPADFKPSGPRSIQGVNVVTKDGSALPDLPRI